MPPKSRGSPLTGFQSKSTPNLPTIGSLNDDSTSPDGGSPRSIDNNPSVRTSIDDDTVHGELLSSDSELSDEETPTREFHQRPLYNSNNSWSHTHLPPSSSQLFPPFYNRPPTPLPPSPSLTSLLRPSFSAHASQLTTPESSDTESQTGTSTAAGLGKVARIATDVPRVSPKVPTYEYYGFALYLASSAAFLMYLLWSFLPSPFLHQLGIHYYPNRWWALAVPAWLVALLIYIYIALASYNTGYLTLPMSSLENLVDDASQVAIVDKEGKIARQKKSNRFEVKKGQGTKASGRHSRQNSAGNKMMVSTLTNRDVNWKSMWNEGTDAVMDVPIGGVCEILYGAGREQGH
jgi:phosphatidylinositol glycan class P protein